MTSPHPEVRQLLEARNFAHVATALPDGSPHSVPTWIGVEGDHVAFYVEPDGARVTELPFRHTPS